MPSEAAFLRLVSEASAEIEDSRDQDQNCSRQTNSYPCGRCTDKEARKVTLRAYLRVQQKHANTCL